MRLFAAIQFSPAVRSALGRAIVALRAQGGGTFTRPENLHLTLAFIGETDRVEDAKAALKRAAAGGGFRLTAEGLGRFDDLWWAGVRENAKLEALALGVQQSLRDAGFPIEKRPWKPHITLVRRWHGPKPQVTLSPTSMRAHKVSLMKSERIDGQLVYTEIYSVEL